MACLPCARLGVRAVSACPHDPAVSPRERLREKLKDAAKRETAALAGEARVSASAPTSCSRRRKKRAAVKLGDDAAWPTSHDVYPRSK